MAGVGAAYRLMRPPRAGPGIHQGTFGPIRQILVIRLDLLGDVLLSMPAVEALRTTYPAAQITMVTLPYTAPLARLYDSVDEVIAVDTNRIRNLRGLLAPSTWRDYWQAWRRLRRHNFDLCLSLSGQMASLWAFLSGARRTFGYLEEAYPFLLTDPIPGGRHGKRQHEVEYAWRLARAAGATARPSRLSLPVPPAAVERVERLLQGLGIEPDRRLVLVHAGSINGSAKRWPAGSWGQFISELRRGEAALQSQAALRPPGGGGDVTVALIGAASDERIAQEVQCAAAAPPPQGRRLLVSLVGRTDIEELIALIARADLVATGDSGPLHLAVALRRPVVAVYGPTDPAVYGPYRPLAAVQVHRRDLPCSPCYTMATSAECPLGDPICMRLVRPAEMVESARVLLGR